MTFLVGSGNREEYISPSTGAECLDWHVPEVLFSPCSPMQVFHASSSPSAPFPCVQVFALQSTNLFLRGVGWSEPHLTPLGHAATGKAQAAAYLSAAAVLAAAAQHNGTHQKQQQQEQRLNQQQLQQQQGVQGGVQSRVPGKGGAPSPVLRRSLSPPVAHAAAREGAMGVARQSWGSGLRTTSGLGQQLRRSQSTELRPGAGRAGSRGGRRGGERGAGGEQGGGGERGGRGEQGGGARGAGREQGAARAKEGQVAGAGARAGNADGVRPAGSTAAVVPVSEGVREGGGAAGTAPGLGDMAPVTPSPFSFPAPVPLGMQSEPGISVGGVMAQESAVARTPPSSSSSRGLAPGSPPRRMLMRSSSTPAQVNTAAVGEPRADGWLEEGLCVGQEGQGAGSGEEGAPRGDKVCTVAEVVEEGGAGEEVAEAVGEEELVDDGEGDEAPAETVAEAASLSQVAQRLPEGNSGTGVSDVLGAVQEQQQLLQRMQQQEPRQQDKRQQEQRQGQLLPALDDPGAADSDIVGTMQAALVSPFGGAAPAVSSVALQTPAPDAAPHSQAPSPRVDAAPQALTLNAAPRTPSVGVDAAPQAPSPNAAFPAPAPSAATSGPSPPPPQTAGWDWVPAVELPAASAAGAGAGSRPGLAWRQQQPKQQLKQRLAQGLWQPEPWVLKVRQEGVRGSFLRNAGGYVKVGNT